MKAGHVTDVSDNLDDIKHTNTHVDDDDDILIESTSLETDCIDFGSRALHHEDIPKSDHYNVYDSIMPRAKELVSLVDASKIPKGRGLLVEEAPLNKIISRDTSIWLSCWKSMQNICLVMEFLTVLTLNFQQY